MGTNCYFCLVFFDEYRDLLRQHSAVIFANVFNLHILVITRALKINCMDSRQRFAHYFPALQKLNIQRDEELYGVKTQIILTLSGLDIT